MSEKINEIQYYIGKVSEICDDEFSREYHLVKVDIAGVIEGARAFPKVGEIDEPCIGDQVLVLCLDPIYFSYLIYSKLKETDFVGFRASGKMLDITPDSLSIGVYEAADNTHDTERPEPFTQVLMKDDGNVTMDLYKPDTTLTINQGRNRGVVNIAALEEFMLDIQNAFTECGRYGAPGATYLMGRIPEILKKLEDKRFKH